MRWWTESLFRSGAVRHHADGRKVSTGAVEHVPVVRVNNMVRCIETLQQRGISIVGSDAAAEQAFYTEVAYDGPVALVIGSGERISRLVREKVDFLVRFPWSATSIR